MTDWHVHRADGVRDRLTAEAVRRELAAGTIGADTLLWTRGMPQWRPATEVFGREPKGPPDARLRVRSWVPWMFVPVPLVASVLLQVRADEALTALRAHLTYALAIPAMAVASALAAAAGVAVLPYLWRRRAGGHGAVVVVAGLFALVELAHAATWILAGRDFYAVRVAMEAEPDATIFTRKDGTIVVDGQIGPHFAADLRAAVERATPPAAIELTSPGGLLEQALDAAAFLEASGVPVTVRDHCLSACVLLAVGARRTLADPDAVFGFHRGYSAVELSSEIAAYVGAATIEQATAYLRGHGVPDDVLAEADGFGPDELYFVTAEEMVAAGAITGLSRGE